jgi:hypothetical protein
MAPTQPITPLRQRMLDDIKLRNMRLSTRKIYVSSVARMASLHSSPRYQVGSRLTIRITATVLPSFLAPSLVPVAQLHTSPFLNRNSLSFCITRSSPAAMWQTMSFIMVLDGRSAPAWKTTSTSDKDL